MVLCIDTHLKGGGQWLQNGHETDQEIQSLHANQMELALFCPFVFGHVCLMHALFRQGTEKGTTIGFCGASEALTSAENKLCL